MGADDPNNRDEFREQFYATVKDVYTRLQTFEEQTTGAITEYKKTVNNAISFLSKEFLDFQTKDVADRKARQKRTDIKDGIVIIAAGCLVLIGVGLILALLGLISVIVTRGGV